MTIPSSPVYLVETITSRTTTSVSFSWSNGVSNGGSAIIDYRISYDQGLNQFVVLASGVLTQNYTATGLISGLTY